ncbi:MAG: M28 family metallopeptidase [Candidatus Fimimonas sp.]
MKKTVLVLLCVALVALFAQSFCGVAVAEVETDYKNSEAYAFLKEFVTACPNRKGADGERVAADWLAQKFSEVLGYDVTPTPFGSGNTIYGYNVEGVLKSSEQTDKQIIIGAHLDSVGEGANDNASGITAMFLAMKRLANESLPFNVVFVAFGGEEQGFLGSKHFVDNMTSVARNNTLVMFNLESIGGGDNLYVFCENKQTDLADLILKNAAGTLFEKPHAVGVFPLDLFGYGYYETVQGSDHTPFRLLGIPTAMFFAGNFSAWNYVESLDKSKNVMNSNSDQLANMEQLWGEEFFVKTETVLNTLCATLLDENFLPVAENAANQLVNNALFFNVTWAFIAVVLLLALVALFGWLHYRKLQKLALLGTVEAKERTEIFKKPEAEDIFDFNDKK